MPIPTHTNQEERLTARERVYRTMQQWIVDGTMEPGERINDAEIAKYFSVSRTPVREAIQQLAEQKLGYSIPSSGTYVAEIDEEDMRYVYTMMGEMHALAVRFCEDKIDDNVIADLEELNEEFLKRAKTGSALERAEADLRFHNYLCKLAGNPYLYSYANQLAIQVRRNENRFFKDLSSLQTSYETHKQIIHALKNKNWADARNITRDNWIISTSIFSKK